MSALLAMCLSTMATADPGVLDVNGDEDRSPYFDDLLAHWETGDGPMGIVNGETTSDYPATVSLSVEYGGTQSFCSGTLIHKRWILTAAHCLEGVENTMGPMSELRVIFGSSISNVDKAIGWEEYHYHQSYSSSDFDWDIGLVKLAEPVEDIAPVVVNDELPDDSWIDSKLTFVGFGVTSDNAQDSGIKRTTDLSIVDYDDQFIFTFDPNTNTCYGDSGGPGYEVTKDGLEVAGVVSYGEGGCVNGGGTGNTNVAEFIDWISEYVTPQLEPPKPDLGGDGGLGLGVARDLSDSPFASDRAGSGAQLGCSSTGGAPSGWFALLAPLALMGRTKGSRY